MGIVSGSISFTGRFGGHFGVGIISGAVQDGFKPNALFCMVSYLPWSLRPSHSFISSRLLSARYFPAVSLNKSIHNRLLWKPTLENSPLLETKKVILKIKADHQKPVNIQWIEAIFLKLLFFYFFNYLLYFSLFLFISFPSFFFHPRLFQVRTCLVLCVQVATPLVLLLLLLLFLLFPKLNSVITV